MLWVAIGTPSGSSRHRLTVTDRHRLCRIFRFVHGAASLNLHEQQVSVQRVERPSQPRHLPVKCTCGRAGQ